MDEAGSTGLYLLSQGRRPTPYLPRTENIQETIREAICRGKAVTLGHTGIAHGIAPGHMVSVLGFSNEGRHVHLLDPYGRVVVASASMLSSYPTYVEA